MFDHLTNPVLIDTRAAVQRFIDEELRPLERELGLGTEDPWPREVLRKVWRRSSELGLYAACLPVELGGKGLNIAEQCALKADLAASGAVLAPHVLGDLGGPPRVGNMLKYATSDQLARYFQPVIRGEKSTCFALTEPHSGSDAQSIRTSAVVDGDELVINGQKHYISGAPFADFAIVMCVTDATTSPPAITAVLVDLDLPGVTVSTEYVPMSGQHIDGDIRFENVRVPRANIFGGEGRGFKLGMSRINVNRLLHCPSMLGLATRAYQASVEYAGQRRQFGGPIARFQAIQHMLADMAAALWACESMIAQTAMLADAGADLRMKAAACKLFVSERCFEVADKAVQIHGNVGVTRGHPVEQTWRKLRMFRIFTGTSEIQRNTIAKAILDPGAA
ncbi:acyl-CoA dehydrogenase family protein [Cupriavidus pauculus]|jgi:alkylation response protein AidB-like acyl-CoA dehydrogenase|uniref:acyl-CoA dehydrogenase family protein n=1 Tax=Cupriavidus pauculus TaxID=82633 RepID=UPI0012491457|nr:acyl-CoA dehydrogenase family protein [Cupriavidus pauculus]KAB0603457.1 acyl-CoA dehydrogenase family protein [Cupriavidus pauculus]MCM3605823.1 acyl-CoA dehydrogenase family protein [Cupriavidus pauculus]UAL02215.1 acyl-CoA dehydrogenase family protein [Cupriavidus pauculus]